jgi:HK97 family phage major capsid protein
MAKSLELKRKAGQIATEMLDLRNQANGNWTEEQTVRFDKLDKEYEGLLAAAQREDRIEQITNEEIEESREIEKSLKPGDLSPEKKKEAEALAMREYLATGQVPVELKGFMRKAKAEDDDNSRINAEFKKLGITRAAQQSTTDAAGGYTIPDGFQAELDRGIKAFGGMFETSRIWKTSTGNTVVWPNNNDTANKAYLLAEAGNAETGATAAVFGQQSFEAYKYTSGLIRISTELLQDSAFNMPALINELLAERMFRGLNTAFTTADGSSKPKGITVAAFQGNNTADDAALAASDFLNLEHKVDPGYRNRPGTGWMFHDSVLKQIKKLSVADTTVYPLWLPSFRDGAPSTILGYKYTINQDMAAYTDGSATLNDSAKIALFGDLQKYVIRQVAGMRIVRLNERFGDTDEVGFVVFARFDGDLLDAGTRPVRYMRMSAT